MRSIIHWLELEIGFHAGFDLMLFGKRRLRIGSGTRLHRALAFFLRVSLLAPVYLLLDLAFGGGDSIGGARKAVIFGMGSGRHRTSFLQLHISVVTNSPTIRFREEDRAHAAKSLGPLCAI